MKRPQTYIRRHGDAWVRYHDGYETGLMPRREAKDLATHYGGTVHIERRPSMLARLLAWCGRAITRRNRA